MDGKHSGSEPDSGSPGQNGQSGEKAEICAFSDGAVAVSPEGSEVFPFLKDNITVREGTVDGINEKDLKSPVMTGISGNLLNYITKGAKAIGHIIFTQIKAKK